MVKKLAPLLLFLSSSAATRAAPASKLSERSSASS
mgnify:CR=1 FL=1|jgi:hypothetical protein